MTSAPALALRLAKETARRFGRESLRPLVSKRRHAGPDALLLPARVGLAFVELGLGIAHLPSEVGGIGLGPLSACLVAEALARGDVNAAFSLPQPGAFADIMCQLASHNQRKVWLHPLLARPPTSQGAVVIGAPGTITAELDGDAARLHGQVRAVWHADRADRFVVVAELTGTGQADSASKRCAFVLDRVHEGLVVGSGHSKRGLPTAKSASVQLIAARVPRSQWLREGDVALGLQRALTLQALRMGSLALGAAHAASGYMVDLAEQRRQLGGTAANFHSMGFLLVDMHLACEAAFLRLREVAGEGALPAKGDPPHSLDDASVAAARVAADEVAFFVTESAHQMLQDAGESDQSHPIAAWHEDIKVLAQSYRAEAMAMAGPEAAPAQQAGGWLC